MSHKLIPLGNDCVIVPIEESNKIVGSILYKPDTAKKRINNGIVIAVGSDVSKEIAISDHVLFNGRSGDQVSLADSGRFFIVPESHIIGKLVQSKVKLVDTETVKRIIEERIGEFRTKYGWTKTYGFNIDLDYLEDSLKDRIDSLTMAEGFEF